MLTEERKRELDAMLAAIFKPKPAPPKPKVVVSNGVAIRDADVVVSPKDPNSRNAADGVVSVRRPEPEWLRPDRVTLNLALAERQLWERQQVEAANRPPGRDVDPMGVWGSRQDD